MRSSILVKPVNPEALADAILLLYSDPDLRESLASAGLRDVKPFEMHRVAARCISEIAKIGPALKIMQRLETEDAS